MPERRNGIAPPLLVSEQKKPADQAEREGQRGDRHGQDQRDGMGAADLVHHIREADSPESPEEQPNRDGDAHRGEKGLAPPLGFRFAQVPGELDRAAPAVTVARILARVCG